MNLVNFSIRGVCALAVVLTPGALGITCYEKHFGGPTTVSCKDGSCFVNIYHDITPIVGAGCGPKHETGYKNVGSSTFYYCNEDLCNKYWVDRKQLLVRTKQTEQMKLDISNELKNEIRDRAKNEMNGKLNDGIRGKLDQ